MRRIINKRKVLFASNVQFLQASNEKQYLLQLICNRWIVTAGHCLQKRVNVDVYLGFLATNQFDQSFRIDPSNQHIHAGFDGDFLLHDIG